MEGRGRVGGEMYHSLVWLYSLFGKADLCAISQCWELFGIVPGQATAEEEESGDIVFDPEENLDMPMSVPSDAILEEVVPDIPGDPYLFVRTRSKRALIEEAKTLRHRMSHYPHNPYCQECIKANMRQRRYAHKVGIAYIPLPAATACSNAVSCLSHCCFCGLLAAWRELLSP